MNNDGPDFAEFMEQRAAAALAYVRGDAAPLGQLVARISRATFFSPRGDYLHGADAVWSRYQQDAAAFEPGGDSQLDILDMGASGGIAYWVGIQRASVCMRGHAEAVSFNLRITEVFRQEGNDWKLIHRHADALVPTADPAAPAPPRAPGREEEGAVTDPADTPWTHEAMIETSAPPPRVWELFADIARWKDWNGGIERIEIHGPFAAGTTFTMQPPGQEALLSTLVEVMPNERFSDETMVGETRVVVSHTLVPLASGGTRIVYATSVSGPGAAALGPVVTSDFPEVLAALKRLAEQEPSHASP